jgi:glycosyltransferase involved in cell wall biosynthesis
VAERLAVGVAIPARNAAPYLAEALASVRAQTWPVADVVVVDDGSDDKTADVARAAGPPVRVVSQPALGVGAARTRAAELVEADVVVMLDADDLLTPRSVECRAAVLLERPSVDLVYGQIRCFARIAGGRPVPLDEVRPAPVAGAMMLRRSAFERVGPFRTGIQAEGLEWLLRAHELGLREWTVPEQVHWRRVHPANSSGAAQGPQREFARLLKDSLDRRRAQAMNDT